MVESLQAAAQLTSVLEVDVKPLVELRAQSSVGVTAIVVKLAADALRDHPRLNARVTESERRHLIEKNDLADRHRTEHDQASFSSANQKPHSPPPV